MIGTDEKVGRFLNYFIGLLNRQRAGLLPFNLHELAEIGITETGREIEEATDKIIEAVREVPGTSRLHSISYRLGRPETIGDGFVGRDKDLDMIKEGFQNRRAIVISGGAGSGKSRLAAEYAHRSDAQGFWTAAGSDVVPTITALAPALDIEIGSRTDDEVAADVCRVLSNMPSDTLWVIDNLEQLEMVNLLLNTVSISLLITTRDDRNQVLSTNIGVFQKLRELDSASAIRLLIMASESDPNELDLLEIADVVGYLPVALEMLAIRLGEFNQSPNNVLDELRKVPTPIELDNFRKAGGTISDRLAGVYNTITGTLEKLPNDVRAAISPLGYVSDARIPNAFLSAITGISPQGLNSVIEECRLRSIVSVVVGDAIVHALTIAAIAATNPAGNLETTLGRAGGRLENIARKHLFLRAELTHHERILSESRKILESEHIVVTAFASNLAIGYRELGRYEDAVRLNEETLPIMERVLGPEHPDTVRCPEPGFGLGDGP